MEFKKGDKVKINSDDYASLTGDYEIFKCPHYENIELVNKSEQIINNYEIF